MSDAGLVITIIISLIAAFVIAKLIRYAQKSTETHQNKQLFDFIDEVAFSELDDAIFNSSFTEQEETVIENDKDPFAVHPDATTVSNEVGYTEKLHKIIQISSEFIEYTINVETFFASYNMLLNAQLSLDLFNKKQAESIMTHTVNRFIDRAFAYELNLISKLEDAELQIAKYDDFCERIFTAFGRCKIFYVEADYPLDFQFTMNYYEPLHTNKNARFLEQTIKKCSNFLKETPMRITPPYAVDNFSVEEYEDRNLKKPDYADKIGRLEIKSIRENYGSLFKSRRIEDEYDELMEEALKACLNREEASASLLQRKLCVGFARASRIIDEMEEQGFCGPADGSKSREMLITWEDFERIKRC